MLFFSSKRFGVPLPVHLYGQFASHEYGRDWLIQTKESDRLLCILRDASANMLPAEAREVKAAIFALAHMITFLDMGMCAVFCYENFQEIFHKVVVVSFFSVCTKSSTLTVAALFTYLLICFFALENVQVTLTIFFRLG